MDGEGVRGLVQVGSGVRDKSGSVSTILEVVSLLRPYLDLKIRSIWNVVRISPLFRAGGC